VLLSETYFRKAVINNVQAVPKMIGQVQEWVTHTKTRAEVRVSAIRLVFHVQPTRSRDLNPLDFCLCGHLETLVYSAPIENEGTLNQRIFVACPTIRSGPGIFDRVRYPVIRRVHACIDSGGGHSEHFL